MNVLTRPHSLQIPSKILGTFLHLSKCPRSLSCVISLPHLVCLISEGSASCFCDKQFVNGKCVDFFCLQRVLITEKNLPSGTSRNYSWCNLQISTPVYGERILLQISKWTQLRHIHDHCTDMNRFFCY